MSTAETVPQANAAAEASNDTAADVAAPAAAAASSSDTPSETSPASPAKPDGDSPAAGRLREIRGEIERIDRELIGLIANRVKLAREVGVAKRELGIPTLDPAREAAVVRRAGELAREAGLGDEDVRYIFWHLIGLSRRVQMEGE